MCLLSFCQACCCWHLGGKIGGVYFAAKMLGATALLELLEMAQSKIF